LFVEGEEIRTTANHLFFTDNGWWKAAENLKVGDKILNSKGELKTLIGKSVETLQEPERIYNLNVENFHTYFVGTNGLLVHNDCSEAMTNVLRKVGADALSAAKRYLDQAKGLASRFGYDSSKTVASDGVNNTLSGWGAIDEGAEFFNRTATTQDVISKSAEIGHDLKPAGALDQGISGQFNASHAEKQMSLLSSKPIGVSRAMCSDCIEYFKKLAKYTGTEKVVADPDMTRIFMTDGITIIEIPHT
jgi:hypothetical protein